MKGDLFKRMAAAVGELDVSVLAASPSFVRYFEEPDADGNVGVAMCPTCEMKAPFRDDTQDPQKCACGTDYIIDENDVTWEVNSNFKLAARLVHIANGLLEGEGEASEWEVPANFYKGTPAAIATGLKRNSEGYEQAIKRLTAYINRAGVNLSVADKTRLNSAKAQLRKLYGR